MPKVKIAITMSKDLVDEIDRLVSEGNSANRSRAIESAVENHLVSRKRNRLLVECRKLDPVFERDIAEEGLAADASEWPEY
jgi:metal-responsive CopG/Arc/MetJ family transcriptional regulator